MADLSRGVQPRPADDPLRELLDERFDDGRLTPEDALRCTAGWLEEFPERFGVLHNDGEAQHDLRLIANRLERLRALVDGQPAPTPTRREVFEAIDQAYVNHPTYTTGAFDAMTDAVMALLGQLATEPRPADERIRAAAWRVLTHWSDCNPPADLANYMADAMARLNDALTAEPRPDTVPASIVERINDGWSYRLPRQTGTPGEWWRVQDGEGNWVLAADASDIERAPMTDAEQIAVYGAVLDAAGAPKEDDAGECKACSGTGDCGYCEGDGCGAPGVPAGRDLGDLDTPMCADGVCTACNGSGLVGGRSAAPTTDRSHGVALMQHHGDFCCECQAIRKRMVDGLPWRSAAPTSERCGDISPDTGSPCVLVVGHGIRHCGYDYRERWGAAPTDEVPCLCCGGDKIDHLLVEGDDVPEPRCLTDLLSDVLHDMETADPPAEPEWTEVVRAVHAAYRRQP